MLYLVQDVIDENQPQELADEPTYSNQIVLIRRSYQKISPFVDLVTAPGLVVPILPPVAILDFTCQFVQCLSSTVLTAECATSLNRAI